MGWMVMKAVALVFTLRLSAFELNPPFWRFSQGLLNSEEFQP
jgi:hypothetical protein